MKAQAFIVQTRPGRYFFFPISVGTAFAEALYGETPNPLEAQAFTEDEWLRTDLVPKLREHCPDVCIMNVEADLILTPVPE